MKSFYLRGLVCALIVASTFVCVGALSSCSAEGGRKPAEAAG